MPYRRSNRVARLFKIAWMAFVLAAGCGITPAPAATDHAGCLLCHKYPGFGRIEKLENGKTRPRIFHIDEELHRASYHARFSCSKCHQGVSEFPHTGTGPVDCGVSCHMMDPSSGRGFSHRDIVDDLRRSAHGPAGARAANRADLPQCRDCHTNKPYQIDDATHARSMAFVQVCRQCHENRAWVERFYRHVNYRATLRRPSKEVVKLCSRCHAEPEMMARHELDVVVGFQDTFHGRAIQYGDEDVANCLSCHAPYALGASPHRITSRHDKHSPVHPDNKLATCSQCHIGATQAFATRGRAHPDAVQVSLTHMVESAGDDLQRGEAVHTGAAGWIRLIYQIAIAFIVGGLALHRVLDLLARRRDRLRGGH